MHVLYFHQHFSTPRGATGTRSYEVARRLIARGHEVTMVCGSSAVADTGLGGEPERGARRGAVDGIGVIEIVLPYSNRDGFLKRTTTFLRFALRSAGIALRSRYDLLFATSTPLTAGIPGICMKAAWRRKPFVFEVRDLWPELPREMGVIRNRAVLGAMSLLEWLSYHAADACVGLSPGIVDGIRRRGIAVERTLMVPNGCDLELFGRRADSQREGIPGVRAGELAAVFTGAHGIANGLESVLDAARVLRDRGREDIRLVFVGDGKLKPPLVARARDERLESCVFLDPVPKTRLAALLAGADVGLMVLADCPAFRYGTSPNKFFDYIASGLPVLNNYPGWLAEMIEEHRCGLAVPPRDPAAFADALVWLAEHPAEREAMGRRGRELAEREFGRVRLADRLVDFLEKVHGSRP
jgi:glycosyltransferase involved in cell wall biosynthesis